MKKLDCNVFPSSSQDRMWLCNLKKDHSYFKVLALFSVTQYCSYAPFTFKINVFAIKYMVIYIYTYG